MMPVVGILAIVTWAFVLAKTRTVSIASITACIALPFFAFAFYGFKLFFFVALLMGIIAFLKHIPNMKRIAAGTEPKFGQKPTVTI
jgi:glycerol-3-phosphate acyltransferase PlsY